MTFDPLTLFAGGAAGGWYDPSDIATMFQDTAATVPVTAAGQPVARVNDKSGNGKNLTQSTLARQPSYQVDSNGKAYLLFDGVDDNLTVAMALNQPWDRISALRQITWSSNDNLWSNHNSTAGRLLQTSASPTIALNDGASLSHRGLAIGLNGVVTERHIAGASQLAVNNGAYVTGDAGAIGITTLALGANSVGSTASNIRFYGGVVRTGSMTDEEITGLRAWLAERAGVILPTRRKSRHGFWI